MPSTDISPTLSDMMPGSANRPLANPAATDGDMLDGELADMAAAIAACRSASRRERSLLLLDDGCDDGLSLSISSVMVVPFFSLFLLLVVVTASLPLCSFLPSLFWDGFSSFALVDASFFSLFVSAAASAVMGGRFDFWFDSFSSWSLPAAAVGILSIVVVVASSPFLFSRLSIFGSLVSSFRAAASASMCGAASLLSAAVDGSDDSSFFFSACCSVVLTSSSRAFINEEEEGSSSSSSSLLLSNNDGNDDDDDSPSSPSSSCRSK
mmetsp:Transcript_19314/g.41931  ORF Transcript_19314/g.41931 Transcript_19314/m.41931 type:complete len:266 (-) Transcript_19314:388-1185(-)